MSGSAEYPKIYLYRRIVHAKLFIDSHYNESIDLENIADEASFSKFHFIRLFKNIYGCSPYQYLIRVRIDKAKILLQQSLPVAQVCFEIGFESVTSFTGLFKRYTGETPSAYQQHYEQRSREISKAPLKFIPSCFAHQHGWIEKSNFEEVS